jgi:hypothetical protein
LDEFITLTLFPVSLPQAAAAALSAFVSAVPEDAIMKFNEMPVVLPMSFGVPWAIAALGAAATSAAEMVKPPITFHLFIWFFFLSVAIK